MKQHLAERLRHALTQLVQDGTLPTAPEDLPIERTRDPAHGDFASNVALVLAKAARCKPRDLAERIVAALPASDRVAAVEIAGPGFINFRLSPHAYHETVNTILAEGERYGCSDIGRGQRVHLEFVSANPTGPLHVGHGRGAAYGAAIGNLLDAIGYDVHREYYVNDAGRQMDILATSVWLRYLEAGGIVLPFPANGYRGDYIRDIADDVRRNHGDTLVHPADAVLADLPADAPEGDKEARIDALIDRARTLLGDDAYRAVYDRAVAAILDGIRADLRDFGVEYDEWFPERSLFDNGAVDRAVEKLQAADRAYEAEGALWFRSTAYGDEKDRVIVRESGQKTYFASDIAYHLNKFERGFAQVLDLWGADHHGYVPRVRAALRAEGVDDSRLEVLLVQFAILYRHGEKVQMSTRSGEFVTLKELVDEVGRDAARFFYIMRKCEQHLDFDLDLAKSQSNDNPVYYIQYAHARICSVLEQMAEKGYRHDAALGRDHLYRLTESHEQALLVSLARYPEVVESAAQNREPHQIAHYLRALANDLHTYYNAHTFLVEDAPLRNARLNLVLATRQVLRNGLALLGVSSPERM